MAVRYLSSFVGVKDGTEVPALRADGRKVGATLSTIFGRKVAGQTWANGDQIYVGRLNSGQSLRDFKMDTDTSFGTSTISLGTLAVPAKYVNAKTLTATGVPTSLGPIASAAAAEPLTAPEDLYITVGVGDIVAGTVAAVDLIIASVK